ncbi:hypothetical protein JDV02_005973 [Purpureocillium takamizusanense]|uniref:Aminoglycoside phosphotransferase domain-containing protein n=1 Tax=Purpureocillium takamizusanense TaxID=2060973 RepID=A0A9Q8QH92_9HYPO|nr:uncharacterized protein JDV02_005973 [Purpureocillium takamizusanense]UNI19823.1 hypothetical protein JDV02_005973 [Purpureocillium takamizusanense]
MLLALIRLVRTRWTSAVLFLSKLWGRLLHFGATWIGGTKPDSQEISDPKTGEAAVATPGLDSQGFPVLTEDQYEDAILAFIASIDTEAVCALASRYNDGKPCQFSRKSYGSFNVCFFVEFGHDGSSLVVRLPIEPAFDDFDDAWDKLISEVTTIQYIKSNTRIPVPHIRGYGRDAKLTKSGAGMQMFVIMDLIPGKPLDKKLLIEGEEEHCKTLYSQLIDIQVELRKLEFPAIGSLMPNPDGSAQPIVGPLISMSVAQLRQPPLPLFTTAKDYMRCQFNLVSDFFVPPVSNHTTHEVQKELFALHGMEKPFQQVIDPRLDKGPFVLHHMDLRAPNIIVDENLNIQGVIDWEFSGTTPRQLFTPPSWITGHDSIETAKQIHTDFRNVLDEKSHASAACAQLRGEWYGSTDIGQLGMSVTDMAFYVAHVIRRPTDVAGVFCDSVTPMLSNRPIDEVISEFFDEHEALALEVQRRARHSERYTQYLKDHNLYGSRLERLQAHGEALKKKYNWS